MLDYIFPSMQDTILLKYPQPHRAK